MKFIKTNINFLSKDGKTEINGIMWKPFEKEAIGVIQICHGMCEYIEQYYEFGQTFADMGFVVCGIDFLGHGNTAKSREELGYFAKKDGYKILIEDINMLTDIMKNIYPNIPYFMLGHSMGSFAARIFAAKYGDKIDGLLLSGTRDGVAVIDFGILLAGLQKIIYGEKHRSSFLNKLTILSFSRKIKNKKTNADWLSTDSNHVSKWRADRRSKFVFTVSGFCDLFKMIKICNSGGSIKKIPKSLPIYIFSGKNDPVSNFGKGISKLESIYRKHKLKNVFVKLYPNGRHCMLMEKNRDEVYDDIFRFLVICGIKADRRD